MLALKHLKNNDIRVNQTWREGRLMSLKKQEASAAISVEPL